MKAEFLNGFLMDFTLYCWDSLNATAASTVQIPRTKKVGKNIPLINHASVTNTSVLNSHGCFLDIPVFLGFLGIFDHQHLLLIPFLCFIGTKASQNENEQLGF